MIGPWTSAEEIASLVRTGGMSAVEVTRETLALLPGDTLYAQVKGVALM